MRVGTVLTAPSALMLTAIPASLLLLPNPVFAATRRAPADFSGTYTAQTDSGTATLSLTLDADGAGASGTFKMAQGVLGLKGKIEDNGMRLTGGVQIGGQDIPAKFEVRREGSALKFSLIPADTGKPDPDTTVTFSLSSKSGGVGAASEAAAPPAPGGVDRFAGTFKGAEMTLIMKAVPGDGLAGTIKRGDTSFPATARPTGDGIEGVFKAGDDHFDFKAVFGGDGKTLLFTTDGNTQFLVRQGGDGDHKAANPLTGNRTKPANPLSGKQSPKMNEAPMQSAPATSLAGWKTYKHPVGLFMRYPEIWTIKEDPSGVIVIPAEYHGTPNGDELYLVSGAPAQGIASADDPRLAQAFEQQVAKLAPSLHRVGSTDSVQSSNGKGIVMTWEGASPSGQTARLRLFGAIQGNYVVAITAVGEKNKIIARENIIRQIFGSIGAGAAELDPRLVGSWHGGVVDNGKNLHDAAGRQTLSSASDSSTRIVLAADGSAKKIVHSRSIVNTAAVSIDTGDQYETTTGHWNAGSGKFMIVWDKDGGGLSGTYRFDGDRLVVQYLDGSTQGFTRQ